MNPTARAQGLSLLWAVRRFEDQRMKAIHKLALFALVAFQSPPSKENPVGLIQPSMHQLGRAMGGVTPKTVRRAMKDLERWGILASRAHSKAGRHLANSYVLRLPASILPPSGVLPSEGVPSLGVGDSRGRE